MSEGNQVQRMVRPINQWRNMVPSAVAAGSAAQVEYALTDAKTDIEALWCKVAALTAGEQEPVAWPCSLGVGDGDGKLFVHGDYDSIKAAQAIIFQAGEATSELEALRKRVAELEDEAAGYLEELIDHNGDSLDDRRQRRVDELRTARRVREGEKVDG